jgi:hypothetical protein
LERDIYEERHDSVSVSWAWRKQLFQVQVEQMNFKSESDIVWIPKSLDRFNRAISLGLFNVTFGAYVSLERLNFDPCPRKRIRKPTCIPIPHFTNQDIENISNLVVQKLQGTKTLQLSNLIWVGNKT